MTGPTRAELTTAKDLDLREVGAVAPLVLAMLLLGFFPQPVLDVINPASEHFMEQVGVVDDEPTVVPAEAQDENEEAHP